MWSLGATLELDDRAKMEEHMRSLKCLDLPSVPEGSNETIFEFVVNDSGNTFDFFCLCQYLFQHPSIHRSFFQRPFNIDNVK